MSEGDSIQSKQNQDYQATGLKYAGFWIRLFAGLLDLIFLSPLIIILIHFIGTSEVVNFSFNDNLHSYISTQYLDRDTSSESEIINYLYYFFAILYSVYLVSSRSQATWGKRILGIYVGNKDGSKLSPLKATLRCLASLITAFTCGIGFIVVAFNKEKVSLHDFICQTRVFYGKK